MLLLNNPLIPTCHKQIFKLAHFFFHSSVELYYELCICITNTLATSVPLNTVNLKTSEPIFILVPMDGIIHKEG